MKSISLGQGQGEKAEIFIREGLENGDWIFLYKGLQHNSGFLNLKSFNSYPK